MAAKLKDKSTAATSAAATANPLANVLTLAAAASLLLAVMALVFPDLRLWGIHSLAFLPRPLAVILMLCAALLLVPKLHKTLFRNISAISARATAIPAPLLGLAAGVLFYLANVQAPLLGDGQLWLNELTMYHRTVIEKEDTKVPVKRNLRKEPLETLLHDVAFLAVIPFYPKSDTTATPPTLLGKAEAFQQSENYIKRAAAQAFRILSALAGALLVWWSVVFARKQIPPDGHVAFSLLMLCSSSMLLFFGYVEHYSWTSLLIVACLWSGVYASERRIFPWLALLLGLLAIAFHYVAITLLPALLFLLWSERKKNATGKQRPNYTAQALTLLLLFAVAGSIAYIQVRGWRGWISVLPLLPEFTRDGYALLSLPHLLDVLNLLLLLALPAVLIVCFLFRNHAARATAFLFVAALSGSAFALSFNPNLGMGGDWDILAAALWPLLGLAAWLLAQHESAREPRVISALLAIVLLIPVPYICANITTTAAIQRYEALLKFDPLRSAYGWEKLLVYYESKDDLPNAARAGIEAVKAEQNPRLRLKLADVYFRSGKFPDAAREAEIAARKDARFARYLVVVALETGKTGNWRECRRILQIATECSPADTSISNMLTRFDRDVLHN